MDASADADKEFQGFKNFGACVVTMESRGNSPDAARRICGALMRDYEKDTTKAEAQPAIVACCDDCGKCGELVVKSSARIIKSADAAAPAEERYVLGVVLEPDVIDSQGDTYSESEVRAAAHKFMEFYGHMGLMHREIVDGDIRILESYVSPSDFIVEGQQVKKGTWLMGARIVSEKLWKGVKNGEFTGWSIGGSAIREPMDPSQTAALVVGA